MPFRKGYEALYDKTTLADLQDTLEHVWLAIKVVHVGLVAREDIAQLIISAKEARIKEQVLAGIMRPILQSSRASSVDGESTGSQK